MDQVRAIELGGDLHGEPQFAPCLLYRLALGNGAHEVAAEPDKAANLALEYGLAGLDGIEPLFARRIEAELLRQFVERHQLGLFGDAYCPLSLDIGMAADRADACAGPAHIPAHQ